MNTNEKFERLLKLMKAQGYRGNGKVSNFEECKKCRGECCKRNACAYIPSDLPEGVTKEHIVQMLNDGVAMIAGILVSAGYRKHEVKLYLCAPELDECNGISIKLIRSTCKLLTSKGCKLKREERPSQGLATIPGCRRGCENFLDFAKDVIDAWSPYRDLLDEIVKERTGEDADMHMTHQLTDKKMSSYTKSEKISLPEYLKEKLQLVFHGRMNPEVLEELGITGNLPKTLTNGEKQAIETLLEHHFFWDYYGKNLDDTLRWMFDQLC